MLSEAEMAILGNTNTAFGSTPQTKADPTLLLHYTFDDDKNPTTKEELQDTFRAKNHGSAGSAYDLKPHFGNSAFFTRIPVPLAGRPSTTQR